MNGLIFGMFDIGFIQFFCGCHKFDLSRLYHLGGLRSLTNGKRWNRKLNGRKDEQLIVNNCSRKRSEYFLSEDAIFGYSSGIRLINGMLPPFMLYEEINNGEEN